MHCPGVQPQPLMTYTKFLASIIFRGFTVTSDKQQGAGGGGGRCWDIFQPESLKRFSKRSQRIQTAAEEDKHNPPFRLNHLGSERVTTFL